MWRWRPPRRSGECATPAVPPPLPLPLPAPCAPARRAGVVRSAMSAAWSGVRRIGGAGSSESMVYRGEDIGDAGSAAARTAAALMASGVRGEAMPEPPLRPTRPLIVSGASIQGVELSLDATLPAAVARAVAAAPPGRCRPCPPPAAAAAPRRTTATALRSTATTRRRAMRRMSSSNPAPTEQPIITPSRRFSATRAASSSSDTPLPTPPVSPSKLGATRRLAGSRGTPAASRRTHSSLLQPLLLPADD